MGLLDAMRNPPEGGLLDAILGKHNRAVANISGGNMADLRDVGKPGEIAALADEFGKHALPGATPVIVQPQTRASSYRIDPITGKVIITRSGGRVSAWKRHGGRSISGKLMAEQKRLSQKGDFWSKAGALSAGALGGGLSFFEVASDILPGKRFEGRRHDIPGLLDKDTTWAFRAGAAATMLIPVAGPAGAAGRGVVGVGMRVAPRATTKAGIAIGKGTAAAGRGTRATGRLVISTGKRAGRLAAKPVTFPVKAAIGSGRFIIRKGGKVFRFPTRKAYKEFLEKKPNPLRGTNTGITKKTTTRPGYAGRHLSKTPNLKRPDTNAFNIIIPKNYYKSIASTTAKTTPKATTKTNVYARGTPAAKKTRDARAAAKAARKRNGISGGQASSYFAKIDSKSYSSHRVGGRRHGPEALDPTRELSPKTYGISPDKGRVKFTPQGNVRIKPQQHVLWRGSTVKGSDLPMNIKTVWAPKGEYPKGLHGAKIVKQGSKYKN